MSRFSVGRYTAADTFDLLLRFRDLLQRICHTFALGSFAFARATNQKDGQADYEYNKQEARRADVVKHVVLRRLLGFLVHYWLPEIVAKSSGRFSRARLTHHRAYGPLCARGEHCGHRS